MADSRRPAEETRSGDRTSAATTRWDTFMLEVAVVVVFVLATVVVTLETWPAPYAPVFWGMVGLVAFSLYRLGFQLWGPSTSAEPTRPDREESRQPPASPDERLKQQTGEIAGIDMDRVEENILRVPADDRYEASSSEAATDFLDWEEAVETGLVSQPETDGEPEGSGESR